MPCKNDHHPPTARTSSLAHVPTPTPPNQFMERPRILDGDMVVPHPAHVGWSLEDIVGMYVAAATLTLGEIYELVTGNKSQVATVKELSARSGRPAIVFIQQQQKQKQGGVPPLFYIPQRYQSFSPLALTYSPSTGLFGIAAVQAHHDFVCYLCAYTVRIENVADVPNHMLYPYIVKASKEPDVITKLHLLHAGRTKLATAVAKDAKADNYFEPAVAGVLETEKQLAEACAISRIKKDFAGERLSEIDTGGATYAAELCDFLNYHGGDTRVATALKEASKKASDGLDPITASIVGVRRLTDTLLGTMNSRAIVVAKQVTECMSPYGINVKNDVYPWRTLSDMESGNVSASYPRHRAFNRHREEKVSGEDHVAELIARTKYVVPIDMDASVKMVSLYSCTVKTIQEDLVKLTHTGLSLPDTSALQNDLTIMTTRGHKFTVVVQSLQNVVHGMMDSSVLSVHVDAIINECKQSPLETVVSTYTHMPHVVAVGEALQNIGKVTKLQNARFDLPANHMATVSSLCSVTDITDIEQVLLVNFLQRVVVTDFVDLQPMGDPSTSPFTNALKEWATIRAQVENVAKNMMDRMVKFAAFSVADPKAVLATKLLPVAEYERFAQAVLFWQFNDISMYTVNNILQENLKFIRIMSAAFPDQDNMACNSLRSFTKRTKLRYTLNTNDSVMSAIFTHTTYSLDDNFNETRIDSVDVTTLAQSYTDTVELRVEDIDTLVHYWLKGYLARGKYANVLYHLSQNKERISLLKHIVDHHVATTPGDEGDAQRAKLISRTYRSTFVIPCRADVACLDKADRSGRVVREGHSDFIATSSILSDIVGNRMLEGVNVEDPTVKIEELVTAVGSQRLYTLLQFGDTLGWGRCMHKTKNVTPLAGWRGKLLVRLELKTWDVNINEIIKLHSGGYNPEKRQAAPGLTQATFFLGHDDNSLVVWRVMASPPISFPDGPHDSVTLGSVSFSWKNVTQPPACPVNTTAQLAPSTIHGEGTKEEIDTVYGMNALGMAVGSLSLQSPTLVATEQCTSAKQQASLPTFTQQASLPTFTQRTHTLVPQKQIMHIAANAQASRSSHTFTRSTSCTTETHHDHPLFVAYTVSAKPWSAFRSPDCDDAESTLCHLMRARIDLSESSSDGIEDS